MSNRDYRHGFSGTDLISPLQFEYHPELRDQMPRALDHALYRLEEIQGEINDPELDDETRSRARTRKSILTGWIRYYKEHL